MAQELVSELESQIGNLPVEVLLLMDNKKRSIGAKREALMQVANGRFAAYCDDDDMVSRDYCEEIVSAIRGNPDADVVVFTQRSQINGKSFYVRFGLEYKVPEQAKLLGNGKFKNICRPPWHICPWRTSLGKKHHFDDTGFDEDWRWLQKLLPEAHTQARIKKVLHTYRFDEKISEGDQTIQGRNNAQSA